MKRKHYRKKEDYNAVKKYVKGEIIGHNRAVSMAVLQELYGLTIGDCNY